MNGKTGIVAPLGKAPFAHVLRFAALGLARLLFAANSATFGFTGDKRGDIVCVTGAC